MARTKQSPQKNKSKSSPQISKTKKRAFEEIADADMPGFDVVSGYVKEEQADLIADEFEAVRLVFPEGFVERVVEEMNKTHGEKASERAAQELTVAINQQRKKKIRTATTRQGVRKHVPASASGRGVRITRSSLARTSERVSPRRARASAPRFTAPLTVPGFWAFLAILIFASRHHTPRLSSLWSTGDEAQFPFVRALMSRERFFEYYRSFCFEENFMLELEKSIHERAMTFWVPANASAVDESLNPFKGRNPHHVFVARKPHPNGLKVRQIVQETFLYLIPFFQFVLLRPTDIIFLKLFFGGIFIIG
jgi:hypothetical protein